MQHERHGYVNNCHSRSAPAACVSQPLVKRSLSLQELTNSPYISHPPAGRPILPTINLPVMLESTLTVTPRTEYRTPFFVRRR